MGACVSNAGPSSRSPSLPRSSLQSANPQSPDLLCHGIQTRTASDSQSQTSSTQRADLGLLSGTTRSSISADIEQPLAVREQQSKQLRPSSAGSSCPTAVTAADDSTSHSASARTKPPPLTAPIAVYRMRDDEDDDDDEEEEEEEEDEEEEGKFDELELITEEQVFAAAHDSFDDDQSLNAAPMNARRMSLLASAPPGSSISSSLSLGDSPLSASMERRLTVTVSVGSFHVLLVDEDEQHAALIARWLRKKQFVVTVCADGEEAVSLMQEVHEASRARNAMQPSDAGSSRHSVSCLDPSQLHDIDLIISDTCMTGSDGQPFLDFCKHSPAFAHIPLVLMSVDVESAAVNRSINRGAYDHWTKPLARPLLQNTVRVIREGQKEARKASLLREWGDRYKQTMIEERRAAIGQGHQPHTLSATPLTAMRSAMLLTPLAPSARSLPPINGATGGWSAAAQYGQLMAQEGRTFAVVLNAAQEEEEQLELERLREWMRELHVEHSVVSSVSDVSKRVERMTKSSADMLVPLGRKRGKSWQSSTYQIPLPVARIQEEEREQESDAAASLRRRDEVNAMRVKGIIGLMKQRSHSRSKTNCELAEQFADRDVDLLVVDVDGLDAEALKECHAMLERATQKAVSIIVMSDSSSTLVLPSRVDIDAILQKPVRKETFCTKVSAIIARRQARLHSSVLAQRAEGYKDMVHKIRMKRASQLALHGNDSNSPSPPSKTVSMGPATSGGRWQPEGAEASGRARSGSQPGERERGEKHLVPLERVPSLPLAKLQDGEEQKESSDQMGSMPTPLFHSPVSAVRQLLQPINSRAASAQHRLQQLDANGTPQARRALSINKPLHGLEHGSLRNTPRSEEGGRRLSST